MLNYRWQTAQRYHLYGTAEFGRNYLNISLAIYTQDTYVKTVVSTYGMGQLGYL